MCLVIRARCCGPLYSLHVGMHGQINNIKGLGGRKCCGRSGLYRTFRRHFGSRIKPAFWQNSAHGFLPSALAIARCGGRSTQEELYTRGYWVPSIFENWGLRGNPSFGSVPLFKKMRRLSHRTRAMTTLSLVTTATTATRSMSPMTGSVLTGGTDSMSA